MPILFDTNILVQLSRRASAKVLAVVNPRKQDSFISIVTVGEIRSLAFQNGWGSAKFGAMEAYLSQTVAIDINYGQVLSNYVAIDTYSQRRHPTLVPDFKTPRNMGKNDLWIAATAMSFDLELVTTDDDFDHLDGTMLSVRKIEPARFIGL